MNTLMFCTCKECIVWEIKFIVRLQLLKSFLVLVLFCIFRISFKTRSKIGSPLIHIIFFFPDLFIILPLRINKNEIEILDPHCKITINAFGFNIST